MAKYMITASYSAEGLRGLQKDGATGRREAVRQAVESVGGRLEAYYFAFGEDDVVSIVDVPGNVAVSALSLAVSASGRVRTQTTPLLTAEEVDQALGMTVSYRGAGG